MLLHWIFLIHSKHMIDNNTENWNNINMQFIIFQHTIIVPKYFQTSANKPKFIHSKYIIDNNGELKKQL